MISADVQAEGGQIIVASSESQEYVDMAKSKWKLQSLEMIGDPSVSMAQHLKSAGLLDVVISLPDPDSDAWTAGHPYQACYLNGVSQPATLVISEQREIWFSHAVVPKLSNTTGAAGRPVLKEVWQAVKNEKLGSIGTSTAPVSASSISKTGGADLPIRARAIFRAILMFVMIFIAVAFFRW